MTDEASLSEDTEAGGGTHKKESHEERKKIKVLGGTKRERKERRVSNAHTCAGGRSGTD